MQMVQMDSRKIRNLFGSKPELHEICLHYLEYPDSPRGSFENELAVTGRRARSPSSLYRSFDRLVEEGLLLRSGNTSSARYRLTDIAHFYLAHDYLARPVAERPRARYDLRWLESYEPNVTCLLRASSLAQLEARCPLGSAPIQRLNSHDLSLFMCDLTYSSASLEGSGYKLLDTVQLLHHNVERHGGSEREKVIALNHYDAAKLMIEAVAHGGSFPIHADNLCALHTLLAHDLLADPNAVGQLRSMPVLINESTYMPLADPVEIRAAFELICTKASQISNPFEQAFFLNVHLPYLQPFEDCNKRVARIACNAPLLNAGVTPMAWSGVDKPTRAQDYHNGIALIYERQDPLLFDELFVDCYLRSIERFRDAQRAKAPNRISANYRPQIKEAVRGYFESGVLDVRSDVPDDEMHHFRAYVASELRSMRSNAALGVRYGIAPAAIKVWAMESPAATDEALAAIAEEQVLESQEQPSAMRSAA